MIFWIPGDPKSWARPGLKKSKKGKTKYYPTAQHKAGDSWRDSIHLTLKKVGPDPDGYSPILPVEVNLVFVKKRPKSHFRKGRNSHLLKDSEGLFHIQTPDIDRLVNLILDEFQRAMRFVNDSQVIKMTTRKVWDNEFSGCLAEIKCASAGDARLTLDEIAIIDPR